MGKYAINERHACAIYDDGPIKNPFLSAMPEILSQQEFMKAIGSFPPLPYTLPRMTKEDRRRNITALSFLFIPMDYMYTIYDTLFRAILTTYSTKTILEDIRQTNLLFCQRDGKISYATQADTGSILGVPGVGKTSVVCRCLDTMPQVIEHTEYAGKPFFCRQVLYLRAECPSDCSVKTLAFNIVSALDRAVGTQYVDTMVTLRTAAASALATQIKILCLTFHVGLLVIDEIQNAAETAQRNRQIKPLLRFLLELTNDTGMSIYFIGTPAAEELFIAREHLKRRTRGVRLLPLKPGSTYRTFLEKLWEYQFTPNPAPFTDKLANKLYDYSAGIPAYIIMIFREAQIQALLSGDLSINERIMQRAIDILAIKIPKTFRGGTPISDFAFTADEDFPDARAEPTKENPGNYNAKPDRQAPRSYIKKRGRRPEGFMRMEAKILSAPVITPDEEMKEVPRDYANKRGRKKAKRDEEDLITAYQSGQNMLEFLRNHDLLEAFDPIC